jgi:hypothetical protein
MGTVLLIPFFVYALLGSVECNDHYSHWLKPMTCAPIGASL